MIYSAATSAIAVYLAIALWHHYHGKDLNPKIMLEYFLFALLGAALVLSVLSFQ